MGIAMEKKDFKNLLSETFGKYDKKSEKFLKETIEKNNKFLIKIIKREVREEFGHFVGVAIVPQFDRIYTELKDIRGWVNDLSHRQDQMFRTLEKHEDRFDHLGSRQDKILETLEKQGEILEKHGGQLERIEAKLG